MNAIQPKRVLKLVPAVQDTANGQAHEPVSRTDLPKGKPRKRGKREGFRLRTLPSGKRQWEIRSKKYGQHSDTFPPGTDWEIVREAAREYLRNLKLGNVPTLAKRLLEKISLERLIRAYLAWYAVRPKDQKATFKNEITIMNAFIRNEPALCSKDLTSLTRKDFKDYESRRILTDEVEGYTVTRYITVLRSIYRNAAETCLYGLTNVEIEVPNPLSSYKPPKDNPHRERVLKYGEDAKLTKAIFEQCGSDISRIKWLTLVNLALSTCLRRGVLLKLMWEDVNFDNKCITIKASYWNGTKKAPPFVPISSFMEKQLKEYKAELPEDDSKPECRLFTKSKWQPIIHRTYLWEYYKVKDKIWYDKNGEKYKDYLTFHDLRHTATTRLASKPYSLNPLEYEYLKGNKIDYVHPVAIEMCDDMRRKMDKGDRAMRRILASRAIDPVYDREFRIWIIQCHRVKKQYIKEHGLGWNDMNRLECCGQHDGRIRVWKRGEDGDSLYFP